MLMNHPTAEDFEGFLRSASRPGIAARNTRVLSHLLADCSSCRQRLQEMGWDGARLESLFRFPVERDTPAAGEPVRYDYSQAFAATEQSLGAFFAEGKPAESTPEELLLELGPLPREEQIRWVTLYHRFANPSLVRKLVEMSDAVRYENTAQMLHLADLARLVSEACTAAETGSEPKLADLRSLGWRQYANALRVSGRLREAEEAFANAQRCCESGTGDPLLRAALLARIGSLRYFQRRFDETVSLADEAISIYKELGESRSVPPIMVQKAIAQLLSGAPDAAVRTLNRTLPLIDHEGSPQLLLAACHNLVRAYIELGEPEQALSLFFEARGLYQDFQDPLISLRACWQEGQLLRDLGHLQAAEAALLRARQGFLEGELLYEVAVVSLDLAAVYLRLGRVEQLRETVQEMVPIFTALGVDRDALAALLQLQQGDQQSRQAFELIRYLSSRLEQLPHQQTLK
jgi:tetratricopeptide (TPR) repeat protein